MKIAFTGHRPQHFGGNFDHVQMKLNSFAAEVITELRKQYGPETVMITGMALGWDQAIANVCSQNEFPYIAAVPFQGQESVWQERSKVHYNFLLMDAKEVVYVCPPGYAAWKMQKRNEWMVDQCDLLVALWDGKPGGTGNCVAYAQKVGKNLLNVWQYWTDHKP